MASKEFEREFRELHKGEYNIYLPDNKNPNSPLYFVLPTSVPFILKNGVLLNK